MVTLVDEEYLVSSAHLVHVPPAESTWSLHAVHPAFLNFTPDPQGQR